MLPGDVLTLRECALEAQGYMGQSLSVVAHVLAPTQSLVPEVLLSSPLELGACNQLVIDGTQSTVAGPQKPLTRWTFHGPDQVQHAPIDSILANASVEGDLQVALDFPHLVGSDTGFGLFWFTLTLQNAITGAVGSSTIRVDRKGSDAPAVRLSHSRKFHPHRLQSVASIVTTSDMPLIIFHPDCCRDERPDLSKMGGD